MSKRIILVALGLAIVFGAYAEEKDQVTLIVSNDTAVITIVVLDDDSILYLASNGKYTKDGIVPGDQATILKDAALKKVYVVLANYDGDVVLRYMKTELGQAFSVMSEGLAVPFTQVPFGIVSGDRAKKEGFFAKVRMPRKALVDLPASKEDLISFTLDSINKVRIP